MLDYGSVLLAFAVLTLPLADCDDIAAARSGDLFLACHSPPDEFAVPVIGQKTADDEMDGYVIRLRKNTRKSFTSRAWVEAPTIPLLAWPSMRKGMRG